MECCPECESCKCQCGSPTAIVAQWRSKIVGDSEFACIDDWNEMPIALIGRRVEITVRLIE
jgi:hypothetical protein